MKMKPEPSSTLLPFKEEPASPTHHRGVQIGRRVKDEHASPPRSCYGRIDALFSPLHLHCLAVKEELPPAISKAQGYILHYSEEALTPVPPAFGPWCLRQSARRGGM